MSDTPAAAPAPDSGWLDDIVAGLFAYYITSLPVLLGVLFGASIVSRPNTAQDPISACVRSDAVHYLNLIQNGYAYDPGRRSVVAFFPAYPLGARWLGFAAGLPPDEGALLAANVFLMGAFVFLARWTRVRWPEATDEQRFFVLAVFGLWPMGLFFRMPYAESLFLFAALALLDGMARRWPLALLAVLAGFLTAVRPVGVAATAAFLWHVLSQPGAGLGRRIAQAAVYAPLATWGLASYMLFQQIEFGTPLAFTQTQEHWSVAAPKEYDWQQKYWALATLEPIRGIYDANSARYWAHFGTPGGAPFSVMFWNPIFFVLAAFLLAFGRLKRWVTGTETVLGLGLLAIPYLTRAYEMSMGAHGRFAAIVVVAYLAIGRMLATAHLALRIALLVALGALLTLLTSVYASARMFF
jgi:hypothetical protein